MTRRPRPESPITIPPSSDIFELTEDCVLCEGNYTVHDARGLSCGHVFHVACIDTWMSKQQTCPLCTAPITKQFKLFPSKAGFNMSTASELNHSNEEPDSSVNRFCNLESVMAKYKVNEWRKSIVAEFEAEYPEDFFDQNMSTVTHFRSIEKNIEATKEALRKNDAKAGYEIILRAFLLLERLQLRRTWPAFIAKNLTIVNQVETSIEFMINAYHRQLDDAFEEYNKNAMFDQSFNDLVWRAFAGREDDGAKRTRFNASLND